jgi:hypothetical protein
VLWKYDGESTSPDSAIILMFSIDLVAQMLQNLQGVMLINLLAWGNKFEMNNALTVKKDHQHALDIYPTFLTVFTCGQDGLFH